MRKIEEMMVNAFNDNRKINSRNTSVMIFVVGDYIYTRVFLYGHLIAEKDMNGEVKYSSAGFRTRLTLNRLRALGCNVSIKNGVMYRDDREWTTDF